MLSCGLHQLHGHHRADRANNTRPTVRCWSSLSTNTSGISAPGRAGRSLEAVLKDAGIELAVLGSVRQRNPGLGAVCVEDHVEPLLQYLQSLQLQPQDLQVMLLRCPRLFTYSLQRQVLPVVDFLRSDLGFGDQQVASTLRRFPQVLGYGVKSHLVPHSHYLKSLGITDEELPQLVLTRPQVLGASIELVITYLRKWLRIKRTNVGRLLWSYPLDFSLPRLVLPGQDADLSIYSSEEDEGQEGSGAGGQGDSHGGVSDVSDSSTRSSLDEEAGDPSGPSAAAAGAGSSGSGGSSSKVDGQQEPPQQQQQPEEPQPQLVMLRDLSARMGSAERCSWLNVDIDLRPGRRGSNGSSGGGSTSSNGSSGPQPPSGA